MAIVLDMSMSLDGFITGPNAGPGNGLGDGGEQLHAWLWDGEATGGVPAAPTGVNGQVYRELLATGAVVTGPGTFSAGGWEGDHHDGVPIFVLSRRPPEREWPNVTYLGDVPEAMALAQAAAGERDVLFHGVVTARIALEAGVLDELEIHVVPVLLGSGERLFDGPVAALECTRVLAGESGVTHLHYRVTRA
jgi:dihydrofolate reductase